MITRICGLSAGSVSETKHETNNDDADEYDSNGGCDDRGSNATDDGDHYYVTIWSRLK